MRKKKEPGHFVTLDIPVELHKKAEERKTRTGEPVRQQLRNGLFEYLKKKDEGH